MFLKKYKTKHILNRIILVYCKKQGSLTFCAREEKGTSSHCNRKLLLWENAKGQCASLATDFYILVYRVFYLRSYLGGGGGGGGAMSTTSTWTEAWL